MDRTLIISFDQGRECANGRPAILKGAFKHEDKATKDASHPNDKTTELAYDIHNLGNYRDRSVKAVATAPEDVCRDKYIPPIFRNTPNVPIAPKAILLLFNAELFFTSESVRF